MYLTLNRTRFEILELTGEECLSAPYKFNTTILLLEGNKDSDYLFYTAKLNLNERTILGVVTANKSRKLDSLGKERMTLTIEPTIAQAKNETNPRVFQRQTIQEIITKILIEQGYYSSYIKFYYSNPQKAYAAKNQPYIMQSFGETNLEFINRLAAEAGLFYWLTSDQFETIHFTDDNSFLSLAQDIKYNPKADFDTPAIKTIQQDYQPIVTNITTIDHNYKYPSQKLIGRHQGQGLGAVYYGIGATTTEEANDLAELLAQINQTENIKVTGTSTINLATGAKVKLLADDYRVNSERSLNLGVDGNYLVEVIKHELKPAQPYTNTFVLHPTAIPYKKPILKPKSLPSIFQARTQSTSEYPEINEIGSYYLQPEFERTKLAFTHTIPKLTPYADQSSKFAESGWHTPIIGDVEVLVSLLDGNPNRPIILGALHHQENPSPIVLANDEHNVLRSPGNSQLFMSDEYHNESIQLNTPGQANSLNLSAKNLDNQNEHQIDLTSQTGAILIQARQDICLNSAATLNENGAYSIQQVFGNHTTYAQQLTYHADTDYQLEAISNIRVEAEQTTALKSGKDLNLTSQQIDLHNQNGNTIFQGSIIAESANELKITAGQKIELSNNSYGIKLIADGKIEFNVNTLNVKTKEIVHLGATKSKVNQGKTSFMDIPAVDVPKDNKEKKSNEKRDIIEVAKEWQGTPYAFAPPHGENHKYSGNAAERFKGGDCSGITHAIYKEAGYDYGYLNTQKFLETAGNWHFQKVYNPQPGDIVVWFYYHGWIEVAPAKHEKNVIVNHMAIYSGPPDFIWTTHTNAHNKEFQPDTIKIFTQDYHKHHTLPNDFEPTYWHYEGYKDKA
jgi:type VI secretion system secreted protein VgrG